VGNLIRSLLFVPFDNPGGGGMVPLLVPGWTLQLELLFYLVFAVALFLPRRVGLIAVAAALIGLAALHGPASHPGMPVALAFYTNPVLSLFVVGMALGALRALIERHGRLPPLPFKSLVMAAVLAGYVAYLVVGGQGAVAAVPRLIYRATPIVVAAMTVLTLENKDNPVDAGLSALGDASYSLYLFHPMMIALIVAVVAGPAAGGHGPAVAVAAAIASLAAALLSYRYVEWPLMAFARRFRRPDAGTPASAASANRFG
jgi:exopolysaccharide production protein ExoZ